MVPAHINLSVIHSARTKGSRAGNRVGIQRGEIDLAERSRHSGFGKTIPPVKPIGNISRTRERRLECTNREAYSFAVIEMVEIFDQPKQIFGGRGRVIS